MSNLWNDLLIGIGLRTKYSVCVNNGIKLLDEWFIGWRNHVTQKLTGYDMMDITVCVLGQVGTGIGQSPLDIRSVLGYTSWESSAAAGFGVYYDDRRFASVADEYDDLAREWNKKLGLK